MVGHHDFGERMKIPDYRIYKVEDVPELMKLRDILAQKGLQDPWLRNEVWRFNEKEWGTHASRLKSFLFRGFKWGFAAFLATIAIEKVVDIVSKKEGGDEHGGGHH